MAQKKSQAERVIVLDNAFACRLKEKTGEDVFRCFQCLKCSTGCPMAHAMDILPHQLIKAVQLGLREEAISSRTIWVCASCLTCSVRCPTEIDIACLVDGLRQMAHARKGRLGDELVPLFHETFLHSLRKRGRVYEIGMLMDYKFKAKQLFKDMGLGWRMFRKGKLRLLPSRVKQMADIKAMFNRCTGV
ncbi:MAG: 4Fe-4S dicluster domain-containing protein [Desulfobacterales bacterium]|nr:4Fe-4S dicluster domain-containing protein [Desulfobacterales bacterium]